MSKIHALLFDWGNVLGRFDHQGFCRKVASLLNCRTEEIYDFVFKTDWRHVINKGTRDLTNLHQSVLKHVSGEAQALPFDVFEQSWTDIVTGDNPKMEAILGRIHPHIKTIVFSNTNEMQWKRIAQLPLIKKYFADETKTVLSFRYGVSKPDQRLFQEAIRRCGCEPSYILYVDDIPDYVRAFEDLGGRGFVYNCETDPFFNLERELNTHGILQRKE
jgi:FMN phosphatase YigB (HAD superfamily)